MTVQSGPALHSWEGHDQDIIVVPSFGCLDQRELAKVDGICHYEERMLNVLFSLRYSETRVVFITSEPLDPDIIQYYKSLMPKVTDFDRRLLLLNCLDSSRRSLSTKILERPRLIQRIKDFIRPVKAFLTCFTGSEGEEEIARQLGCKYVSAKEDIVRYGTKAGSREAFAECCIPHPQGVTESFSASELAEKIAALLKQDHKLRKMVVKLNEGFAGMGNALLDLTSISTDERQKIPKAKLTGRVVTCLEKMEFCAKSETWLGYSQQIRRMGAIAEEYIECSPGRITSPSVQVVVRDQRSEVISTHEQLLEGQTYVGCITPCNAAYRAELMEYGSRLGEFLADKGMMDHFSIDFLAVQDELDPTKYLLTALEINLRRGGTTHPQLTTRVLCNAELDPDEGVLKNAIGERKVYVATDHMLSDSFKGLTPRDLLEIMKMNNLSFSHETQTGAVFHMIGCLSQYGQTGVTCIANTIEDAEQMMIDIRQLLLAESMRYPKSSMIPPTLHNSEVKKELYGDNAARAQRREDLEVQQANAFELDPLGLISITVGAPTELADIRMLVLCCVHGNEVPGLRAINNLLHRGELQRWAKSCMAKNSQLRLMIANPKATVLGKRCVEHNLNRIMPEGKGRYSLEAMREAYGYEGERAFAVATAIRKSTHLLDIHSASSPAPVHLFPGRTKGSKELALQCPAGFLVSEICYFTSRPGTTIGLADEVGVVAIGAEVGQHNDTASVKAAEDLIKGFLNAVHNIPVPADAKRAPPTELTCVGVEIVKKGFSFVKPIMPFQFITGGTKVAEDDEGDIIIKKDAFIALPTTLPVVGEEAFFYCEAAPSHSRSPSIGSD